MKQINVFVCPECDTKSEVIELTGVLVVGTAPVSLKYHGNDLEFVYESTITAQLVYKDLDEHPLFARCRACGLAFSLRSFRIETTYICPLTGLEATKQVNGIWVHDSIPETAFEHQTLQPISIDNQEEQSYEQR